jgi:hypothetical protein
MPVAPVISGGFLRLADEWVARRTDERGIAWFRGAIHDVAQKLSNRDAKTVSSPE